MRRRPATSPRWLIRENLITEYQASLLSKGHVDGFFLNEYKILDRLGQGRMAGVYKAVQHRLGQIVADQGAAAVQGRRADPAAAASSARPGCRMQLKHPNVVRTFQIGAGQAACTTSSWSILEGETLEDVLLRRRQLPPAEAVRLIYQALLGLQHLHDKDMVHRDLKPANLMLVPAVPGDRDNLLGVTVKILDIGLGRPAVRRGQPGVERSELAELTGEGVLLGTPDYMSPEQARDPRTDRHPRRHLQPRLRAVPSADRAAAVPRHEHHQPDDPPRHRDAPAGPRLQSVVPRGDAADRLLPARQAGGSALPDPGPGRGGAAGVSGSSRRIGAVAVAADSPTDAATGAEARSQESRRRPTRHRRRSR